MSGLAVVQEKGERWYRTLGHGDHLHGVLATLVGAEVCEWCGLWHDPVVTECPE